MATIKRIRIYLEPGFDEDVVDSVCDSFEGADFWYGDSFVRFRGSGERLQEFKRALTTNGIKLANDK